MSNTEIENSLLVKTEKYIESFFKKHISPDYVFHNFEHTKNVVEAVYELGTAYRLEPNELEIIQLAAWFHDTGYNEGPEGHEERSCTLAKEFLTQHNYDSNAIEVICDCIMTTKNSNEPSNLWQQILRDADTSHLGKSIYWDRCGRIRQELNFTKEVIMSDQEWIDFEINFMLQHQYYTSKAYQFYGDKKNKHIKQLKKQQKRLNPSKEPLEVGIVETGKKKKKKKSKENDLKDLSLGRGVETMYRATYRTHVNLSSIADNKANIMLSINAIIISIIIGTLLPEVIDTPHLIIPTALLLAVCLLAMVYAVLATRPKITEGKVTKEDIQNRTSNLLFFGNFYNMELKDFHWGMMEMIKDNDFLYSSMTRDLYYLGIVLAKKYRYLRICYDIFMYGLIAAVILFGISILLIPAING